MKLHCIFTRRMWYSIIFLTFLFLHCGIHIIWALILKWLFLCLLQSDGLVVHTLIFIDCSKFIVNIAMSLSFILDCIWGHVQIVCVLVLMELVLLLGLHILMSNIKIILFFLLGETENYISNPLFFTYFNSIYII